MGKKIQSEMARLFIGIFKFSIKQYEPEPASKAILPYSTQYKKHGST